MRHNLSKIKKGLRSMTAAFCAWALLLSIAAPAAAEEIFPAEELFVEAESVQSEEALNIATESELLVSLRNEIAAFISTYGLTPDMPDSELANIYFSLNSEQAQAAWYKHDELVVLAEGLSAEEQEILLEEINSKLYLRFRNVMVQINTPSVAAKTETFTPETGINVEATGDYLTSATFSSGTATIKATGKEKKDGCGNGTGEYQSTSVTIKITNNTGGKIRLSFDYSTTGTMTFPTDGTVKNNHFESSSIEVNTSISITFGTEGKKDDTILTLSNFVVTPIADAYNVTISYNSSLGAVNDTNNSVISSDTTIQNVSSDAGVVLKAVPNSGTTFLGWIDSETGTRISTNAEFTIKPSAETAIEAVFMNANSGLWFLAGSTALDKVDGGGLFDNLNDAAAFAKGKSTPVVIPLKSGTVPAGSHTIPAGVTLLVPRDASDTGSWAKIESSGAASVYRTLTIAEGASLTVHGNIINNATLSSASGGSAHSGEVTGAYGRITNNGTIIMESGATWTARGYVDGSGLVTVKDGASIYQPMVIQDWRGGSATLGVKDSVFPLNIYALLNVMCRTQYQYGSALYAIVQLKVSFNALDNQTAQILGNSAGKIFQMSAGSQLESWFNTSTRKMEYSVTQGSVNLTYMNISVSGYPMSSQETVVPFNDMFVINVENGATATITHSVKLLPGAVVNVKNGGTLKVDGNLYIYRGKDYDLTYANSQYYALPNSGGLFSNSARYSSLNGVNAQINVYGTGKVTGNIYCSSVSDDKSAVVHRIDGGTFTTNASGTAKVKEHQGTTKNVVEINFGVPDQYAVHETDSVTEPNYAQGGYYYTESTVAPTCEDKGYTKHQCSVCDYYYADKEKPANGHKDENFDHKCDNGCGKNDMGTHADSPSDSDHVCDYGCGEVMESCSGGNAPTCTQQSICQVCGQPYGEFAPHALTLTPAVSETCGKAGNSAYNTCSVCFKYFNEAGNTEIKKDSWIIPATENHNYAVVGEYTWSADNTTCSVNGKCQTCDATTVVQATMSDKVTVTATCKTEGLVTRSATFTESWAENQSKEVNVGKNPANHELKTYVYDINGKTHTKKNACCQTVVAENVTHNYDNAEFKCECGDVKKFTVTWIVDGVEKYSELLEYNSDIPEKEIPAKEGYTGKWDTTGKVKGETTITAQWESNQHTVYWKNGEGNHATVPVRYGEVIEKPQDPIKNSSVACITYEFTGWEGYSEGMTMPDKDVTFVAQFKEHVDHKGQYTYTDNGDGTHTGKYACCGADEVVEGHIFNNKTGTCTKCPNQMAVAKVQLGEGDATYFETLQAAIDDVYTATAEHKAVITLLGDKIDLGDKRVGMGGGCFTLDLNGVELTSHHVFTTIELYETTNLELTIEDSSSNGCIRNTNSSSGFAIRGSAKDQLNLTITDGAFDKIQVKGADVTFNGGIFDQVLIGDSLAESSLLITEGTFEESVSFRNGEVTISGGELKNQVMLQDANVTICDTEFAGIVSLDNAEAVISDSKFDKALQFTDSTVTVRAIVSNNAFSPSNSFVTIESGTFGGLLSSRGGEIMIEDGTFNGIKLQDTKLHITGGTINANIDGSISFYNDVSSDITLGVNKTTGIGATFVNGIKLNNNESSNSYNLAGILADGVSYWAGDKMLTVDDNATAITDRGDIIIKATCKHEKVTYPEITDTHHTATCECSWTETVEHSYTNGECACGHDQVIAIRFLDEDGEELRVVEVNYGVVPAYGEDVPVKSAEAEEKCVAYEFAGWSTVRNGEILSKLPEAKENAVYYAVFNAVTSHTSSATWSYDESHHWYVCSACKTIITATKAGHEFEDGICSKCGFQQISGLFRLYGTNLKAGDCLDLFFYVNKSNVDGKSGVYAKITRYYNDHKTAPKERTIVFDDWDSYSSTLYRFCYDDIAAKEMMDQVSVAIYANDENGTPVQISETFYESVENYAIRSLNAYKGNGEGTREYAMCVALADMLNYGAAAQQYFGYNPSNLANARLEANAEYKAFATVDTPECSNRTVNTSGNLLGDSVTASTNMEYNFYFSEITTDMTAYITYTDHYDTAKTQTVKGIDFYTGKNIDDIAVIGVPVKGLAVADGRQLITCVVKDSEGNTRAEATSSIESYVFRQLQTEKAHLFAPLIKFVDSAKTFFDMSN